MEKISLHSEGYKLLAQKIDYIYKFVKKQPKRRKADEWIDDEQACQMLDVSRRTMQRLRSNGKITYFLCGGKVQYKISDVERCANERIVRKSNRK